MPEPHDPVALDAPWTRSPPARHVRSAITTLLLGPLMDLYTQREVHGREHLAGLERHRVGEVLRDAQGACCGPWA